MSFKIKQINLNFNKKKIGVLGGGQLGRMLQEVALQYGVNLYFMDEDTMCPCSIFKDFFTKGSFRNFDDILAFGENLDIITVEIEHINVDALEVLEKKGVEIIPNTKALRMIQNKALQKQFYADHAIPTSPFLIFETEIESIENSWFPCVQKTQRDGYDGKGVLVLNTISDVVNQLKEASIVEKMVDIDKELAITVAIDSDGTIRKYPVCEMVFDPKLNLVDYLIVPSSVSNNILLEINTITDSIVEKMNSKGVFSIEFFLTEEGQVLVNEMAPRTHNSAHYTIEGTNVSQFEAQLKILLNLQVPEIHLKSPSAMINLVGESGYSGIPYIEGIEILNKIENAYIHLYGKKETKPGRKMGHLTILNRNREELIKEVHIIKSKLKIKTDES